MKYDNNLSLVQEAVTKIVFAARSRGRATKTINQKKCPCGRKSCVKTFKGKDQKITLKDDARIYLGSDEGAACKLEIERKWPEHKWLPQNAPSTRVKCPCEREGCDRTFGRITASRDAKRYLKKLENVACRDALQMLNPDHKWLK